MNLKTYRAASIADALQQIKKDLGPDAVILHTRTFKRGGWLGFGGRTLVEITASSSVSTVHPLARKGKVPREAIVRPGGDFVRRAYSGASSSPGGGAEAAILADGDRAESSGKTPASDESPRQMRPAHGQGCGRIDAGETGSAAPQSQTPERVGPHRSQRSPETTTPATRFGIGDEAATLDICDLSPAAKEGAVGGAAFEHPLAPDVAHRVGVAEVGGQANFQDDLAAIKRMVGQVLKRSSNGADPMLPDALFQQYLRLIESEVATEVADEIVSAVRDELTRDELADESIVQRAVLRRLETHIPVCRDAPRAGRMADGRPLTIALVGPTGVGKTTTIAKLAATYKLRHGRKVGLVTSDTYRIAAVDQLRTYANIIGLPIQVAMTPKEMTSCCEALDECDVILIDTAGRSQHDAGRLEDLGEFLDAADPHEIHLVLSSVCSQSVLMRTAERFAAVKPNRLIFTKLDEAVTFGVLINAARTIDARLSYVTTGQEVPDHIEPGRPDRLARLVLEGGAAKA